MTWCCTTELQHLPAGSTSREWLNEFIKWSPAEGEASFR